MLKPTTVVEKHTKIAIFTLQRFTTFHRDHQEHGVFLIIFRKLLIDMKVRHRITGHAEFPVPVGKI